MHSIKFTQLNILKLNSKIYLPYQLHQLPKWFNKYDTEHLNVKGYCYVLLDEHYERNPYFDYDKFRAVLSYNRDLSYVKKR